MGESVEERPWVVRPYEPRYEQVVYSMFLEDLMRSPAGRALGWHSPPAEGEEPSEASLVTKAKAWREHRPLLDWMLRRGTCRVAINAMDHNTVCAIAIHETLEPVVHWFGVKRMLWSVAAELAQDLLGDVFASGRVRTTLMVRDLGNLLSSGQLTWGRPAPDPTWLWRNQAR